MRNEYGIDTLTSVDVQTFVKIGGKEIQIFEGVIYREYFKITPLTNVIGKVFALRQKY